MTSYAAQTGPGALIGRVVGDWNAASARRAYDAPACVHPARTAKQGTLGQVTLVFGRTRYRSAGFRRREGA